MNTAKKMVVLSMVAGSLSLGYREADAQEQPKAQNPPEKMVSPPNLSEQGMFPQPAVFLQLGDFAYATSVVKKGPDGAGMMINKSALGLFQFTLSTSSYDKAAKKPGASWMSVGLKPTEWFLIAYRTPSSQSLDKGDFGAIMKLDHTGRNLTQIGVMRSIGNNSWELEIEERHLIESGFTGILSGRMAQSNGKPSLIGIGAGVNTKSVRLYIGAEENLLTYTKAAKGGLQYVTKIGGKTMVFDSRLGIPFGDWKDMVEKGTFKMGVSIPLGKEQVGPIYKNGKQKGMMQRSQKKVADIMQKAQKPFALAR